MKKKISAFFAAAAVLLACEKDPVIQDNSSISLSSTVITAVPEGGVYEIDVTSGESWKVAGWSEWVRPLAESGKSGEKLKFEVDASDSKEERRAEFKVFSGSATETVTIVSEPSYVMALVSEPEVSFSSDGAKLNVKLDTNIPEIEASFSGNGAAWLEYISREEMFGNTVISFNVAANETYKGRATEITLSGAGKSVNISVAQAKLDAVITATPKLVFEGLVAGEVKLTVRANVDFTYELPDWLTLVSSTTGAVDEEGLIPTELVLSFGQNTSSRIADIEFVSDNKTMLTVSVKQQNPDAILCNIPDASLRSALSDIGWVLSSNASEECEILAPGLEGESLEISRVMSVYGLGAFPKLKKLKVSNSKEMTVLDVTDSKTLEEVDAPGNYNLNEIRLGKSPVTKCNTNLEGTYERNYFTSNQVTVSSENLKDLNMRSFDSMYLYYYDACTAIDVSACPALEKLDAYRIYTLWGNYKTNLTTIYVSQAQMDAYNAGTLAIDRVVKTPDHHEEAALVVK